MEKNQIVSQILNLPKEDRDLFFVRAGEAAKDLSEVMQNNETVEGILTAYDKGINVVLKNGRAMRSFLAVTDKRIYLLSRGRNLLNFVGALDKTIIILRNEITGIMLEGRADPLGYTAFAIVTIRTTYSFVGDSQCQEYLVKHFSNYITYTSDISKNTYVNTKQNVSVNINQQGNNQQGNNQQGNNQQGNNQQENNQQEKICPNCGARNDSDAKFCTVCGTQIPEKKVEKNYCFECGYKLVKDAKFCPNCGTEIK